MISMTPIILCGGSGTRLWPLSRTGFPKQFLCIKGKESLFQQTIRRVCGAGESDMQVAAPLIVTGEDHRFLVLDQLRECGIELGAAILEPSGRNTAAALTLATFKAMESGQDPILVVTPSDQDVADPQALVSAIRAATHAAREGDIVILGVKPDCPNTGYGYIQIDKSLQTGDHPLVKHFAEKPDLETAKTYLQQGSYFWNAGIFVLKASVWIRSLKEFRPDIFDAAHAAWTARSADAKFLRPGQNEFLSIPAESIDRAVIERCPSSHFPIRMVQLDAGWNDLGAWDSIWNALDKDENGNAHVGDVLSCHSSNTLVHATSRLVGLVGVTDLIVVETPDAVLVLDKNQSQNVKEIVDRLQAHRRDEYTQHRKVFRPWGWYDNIDEGHRFKVKRIQVKPGASLSLQKHHHRAEHWIVVTGTAEITAGGTSKLLTENQSTYIPLGEVHRLSNPGITPLEIIEVQSGSYLGEDDIVRIEDFYGRRE